MTVPVGIATLFFYPDVPHNTRAWYLNEDEIRLGIARVQKAGKAPPAKISLSKILQVLKKWSMPDQELYVTFRILIFDT